MLFILVIILTFNDVYIGSEHDTQGLKRIRIIDLRTFLVKLSRADRGGAIYGCDLIVLAVGTFTFLSQPYIDTTLVEHVPAFGHDADLLFPKDVEAYRAVLVLLFL